MFYTFDIFRLYLVLTTLVFSKVMIVGFEPATTWTAIGAVAAVVSTFPLLKAPDDRHCKVIVSISNNVNLKVSLNIPTVSESNMNTAKLWAKSKEIKERIEGTEITAMSLLIEGKGIIEGITISCDADLIGGIRSLYLNKERLTQFISGKNRYDNVLNIIIHPNVEMCDVYTRYPDVVKKHYKLFYNWDTVTDITEEMANKCILDNILINPSFIDPDVIRDSTLPNFGEWVKFWAAVDFGDQCQYVVSNMKDSTFTKCAALLFDATCWVPHGEYLVPIKKECSIPQEFLTKKENVLNLFRKHNKEIKSSRTITPHL